MRSKEEILEQYRKKSDDYAFRSLLLEVLCDIRDELVKREEKKSE